MTTRAFLNRRFRTILDCSLVLLLILISLPSERPIQARTRSQPPPRDAYTLESTGPSNRNPAIQAPASSDPPLELAPQDDNQLAAMIAAENAALTLVNIPIYLPAITR